MSILKKLTPEQIAAFEDCKTKEELLEVAAKLGIAPTEEDIAEAMAMIKTEISRTVKLTMTILTQLQVVPT